VDRIEPGVSTHCGEVKEAELNDLEGIGDCFSKSAAEYLWFLGVP